MKSTDTPSLLNIPLEIRSLIYHHCLVAPLQPVCLDQQLDSIRKVKSQKLSPSPTPEQSEIAQFIFWSHEDTQPIRLIADKSFLAKHVNLLGVCRQIHTEACPILYAKNTFRFDHDEDAWEDFCHFHDVIGPRNHKHLRTLEVNFPRLHDNPCLVDRGFNLMRTHSPRQIIKFHVRNSLGIHDVLQLPDEKFSTIFFASRVLIALGKVIRERSGSNLIKGPAKISSPAAKALEGYGWEILNSPEPSGVDTDAKIHHVDSGDDSELSDYFSSWEEF
ncbi:hypothetical protein MMC12_008128 [Toensbergia leucococca]|nr:hypothetical protein [Toensbergia leucococca]